MSEDGKRGVGHRPQATAPIFDSIGDLIWIDFDPTKGHEQRGRRPALVISRSTYNQRTALCVAYPITNQVKGHPFEVVIPAGGPVAKTGVNALVSRRSR